VVGQLGQVRPRVGGIDGLQHLSDPPVQPHPPGGRQALVEHLTHQRVRKAPAAKSAGDRPDDPGRLGLLQQLQQPPSVQAAGRLQHAQSKVAAQHRGGLQQPLTVVGEAAQPLGDHRLDALRQPGRQHRPGRVAEAALAGQQADDLGDKERVAVALLVHRRRQLRRRRHPGDRGHEAGHLRLVQPAKHQPPVVLPTGQVGHSRKERMPPVHLRVPVDGHHQQPGTL
jgi:hypothetical protein